MQPMERVEELLEQEREKISLIRMPLRTLKLSSLFCAKSITREIVAWVKSTVFIALVPLIILAVGISLFWIDAPAGRAFKFLDSDGDGYVSITEIKTYYANVLKKKLDTDSKTGSIFPRGSSRLDKAAFGSWWVEGYGDTIRQNAFFNQGAWREVEYILADTVWWLGLGILSSVGLGTGMHSGLLFLFPYIYRFCAAADSCGNTNFWVYPVNPVYGPRDRAFVCITPQQTVSSPSVLARVLLLLPACVIWGAGTAIGEIPPYILSYAAAQQGKRNSELEQTSKYDILNAMKVWMLDKIQRHGFIAVLLLAAWPNMAFDLCGMACGQFLMPFWTFFGATLIGKALCKVPMQVIFFVQLFSGDKVERIIHRIGDLVATVVVVPSWIAPGGVQGITNKTVEAIGRARQSIAQRARGEEGMGGDKPESVIATIFNGVVIVAIAFFAKSVVETFAQNEQAQNDNRTAKQVMDLLTRNRQKKNLTDEELLELIRVVRGESEGPSVSSSFEPITAALMIAGSVAGFVMGSNAVAVIGLSLLFHTALCSYHTNESLNPWTLWAVRALLAAAALYALRARETV